MTKLQELRQTTDNQLKASYWNEPSDTSVKRCPTVYAYNEFDEPRVVVRDGSQLLVMDFWPGDNETYLGYIVDTHTDEVHPVYPWSFNAMADYMLSIIEDPSEYPLRHTDY